MQLVEGQETSGLAKNSLEGQQPSIRIAIKTPRISTPASGRANFEIKETTSAIPSKFIQSTNLFQAELTNFAKLP